MLIISAADLSYGLHDKGMSSAIHEVLAAQSCCCTKTNTVCERYGIMNVQNAAFIIWYQCERNYSLRRLNTVKHADMLGKCPLQMQCNGNTIEVFYMHDTWKAYTITSTGGDWTLPVHQLVLVSTPNMRDFSFLNKQSQSDCHYCCQRSSNSVQMNEQLQDHCNCRSNAPVSLTFVVCSALEVARSRYLRSTQRGETRREQIIINDERMMSASCCEQL